MFAERCRRASTKKSNWKEVPGADAYPCKRGVACIVNFDPVKTKAVKLELKQPETHSCGLFEWSVK